MEKIKELERATEKLEQAFDLMRQDNLEFIDAFLNRRIFELKEGIMILRKIIGFKKDDVVGVIEFRAQNLLACLEDIELFFTQWKNITFL